MPRSLVTARSSRRVTNVGPVQHIQYPQIPASGTSVAPGLRYAYSDRVVHPDNLDRRVDQLLTPVAGGTSAPLVADLKRRKPVYFGIEAEPFYTVEIPRDMSKEELIRRTAAVNAAATPLWVHQKRVRIVDKNDADEDIHDFDPIRRARRPITPIVDEAGAAYVLRTRALDTKRNRFVTTSYTKCDLTIEPGTPPYQIVVLVFMSYPEVIRPMVQIDLSMTDNKHNITTTNEALESDDENDVSAHAFTRKRPVSPVDNETEPHPLRQRVI